MIAKRDSASSAFFDAAAEGRLLAQHCQACGHWTGPYTFRGVTLSLCPACHEAALTWEPVSGTAILMAWTVLTGIPTVVEGAPAQVSGVVELTEGPWLPCAVDVPVDQLVVGMDLTVSFARVGGGEPIPAFRSARKAE